VLEKASINFTKEQKNQNTLVNIAEKIVPVFPALRVLLVEDILMESIKDNTRLNNYYEKIRF
jgi:hypothetical protein